RFFDFAAGSAGSKIPTKEQVRARFQPDGTDELLIVRSLKSASDGPVFGAGQLSECWVEWHDEHAENEVEVVEAAAGLAAGFQSPLSYFHLRSWENGHLFTRVGTYLSQRGRRDEVAYEGHLLRSLARSGFAGRDQIDLRDSSTAPPAHSENSGYSVSFVPPAFPPAAQVDERPSNPVDDGWDAGYVSSFWDVALVARALIGTTQSVFQSLLRGDTDARVLDGSMTVLDGTVALVLTLQVRHDPETDPETVELPSEVIELIEEPFCVDGRHLRDRTLQYHRVGRSKVMRALGSDPSRNSLWVSWRGLATVADPSWIGAAAQRWSDNVISLRDPSDRVGDLRIDYLVSRVRRGREQVGRARVSFLADGGNPSEARFGVWERTLEKVIEAQARRHGTGVRIPTSTKVSVHRLEPRSRRFRDGGGA
ncbi:MAG: hypothetical protein KDB24_06530, partial [Microthrixaceae bacterium]|nr:hypothetical protein [Microthrixaceae bacterium]